MNRSKTYLQKSGDLEVKDLVFASVFHVPKMDVFRKKLPPKVGEKFACFNGYSLLLDNIFRNLSLRTKHTDTILFSFIVNMYLYLT